MLLSAQGHSRRHKPDELEYSATGKQISLSDCRCTPFLEDSD